jgi:hypothetical protein
VSTCFPISGSVTISRAVEIIVALTVPPLVVAVAWVVAPAPIIKHGVLLHG